MAATVLGNPPVLANKNPAIRGAFNNYGTDRARRSISFYHSISYICGHYRMGTDRCAQPLGPLEDTAPAVDNRKYHHSKRLVAEWPLALELSRS